MCVSVKVFDGFIKPGHDPALKGVCVCMCVCGGKGGGGKVGGKGHWGI